jgi:hypothetical protein
MGRIEGAADLNADTWEVCDKLWTFGDYFRSLAPRLLRPSSRKYRLMLVASLRAMWYRITDPRVRQAIESAEQYADQPNPTLLRAGNRLAGAALSEARESWDGRFRTQSLAHRIATAASHSLDPKLNEDPASVLGHYIGDILAPAAVPGRTLKDAKELHLQLFHDLFPNPFRPVAFDLAWRTSTAVGLARTMYDSRDFAAMPILADAIEEAGCESPDVLAHCRGGGPHVRGCWVVDLVLGKA